MSPKIKTVEQLAGKSLKATPSYNPLVEQLRRIQAAGKQGRAGHRKQELALLLNTYEVACQLSEDHTDWMAFASAHEWQSFKGAVPRPDGQKDALKHALRFMNGFEGRAATKRTSRQYVALGPLFEKGASLEDVTKALQQKSVAQRARENASQKRKAPPSCMMLIDWTGRRSAFEQLRRGQVMNMRVEIVQLRNGRCMAKRLSRQQK